MTPEEIEKHFGKEALEMLYDSILQNAVHNLADWILSYHTEQEIGEWIRTLKEDEEEE
jgi:hypothetical protein